MEGDKKKVGVISHFYSKINVAIIELEDTLTQGDMIEIAGPTTNVKQKVDSMQIEHKNVPSAKKGQSIGLLVGDKVKEKDVVYKLLE